MPDYEETEWEKWIGSQRIPVASRGKNVEGTRMGCAMLLISLK